MFRSEHTPAGRIGAKGGFFAGRSLAEVRSAGLSSVELVRRSLAAVAELNPVLNAFVTVAAEEAMAAARRMDDERARGIDRGTLHGVPVAVKDIIDVAGLPTTMGSAHLVGHIAGQDAECVRRLRAAGAVVIGKTTTHEFAFGPTGDRSANGPARNPHDCARMAGGSSGGSAVAVAAGMVPVAIGTDTGGSVRIPAALCGAVGFKPAYGAIPVDGVFPLAGSLDHVGVMAGRAADCLHAYRVLAGLPTTSSTTEPFAPRIAWLRSLGGLGIDPAVEQVARRTLGAVDEVEWPQAAEAGEAFHAVQTFEAAAVHADRMASRAQLYDPEVLERLRAASRTPASRYTAALATRETLRAGVTELLERYELLALPTVPVVAPRLQQREVDIRAATVGVREALLSLTAPWNLLGLPAVTVPTGTVAGLPVGTQLITRNRCRGGAAGRRRLPTSGAGGQKFADG